MNFYMLLWGYLVLMNLITFTLFTIDKLRATKHRYRIPEKTLLGFSAAGGSLGAIFAMYMMHHKTRKKPFAIGVPAMIVIHIVIVYFVTHI